MKVGSAISTTEEAGLAAAEAADAAAQDLEGAGCRLAVVFASPAHGEALADVVAAVRARLEPEVLLGGLAQGVVGPGTEAEEGAAVSVWCASFAGAVHPFRSWGMRTPEGGMAVAGWPDTEPDDVVVLLADPFSYPAPDVVRRLGEERPGHPIVGGMLTPGQRGAGRLVLGDEIHDEGAVGVVLSGVDVDTIVSQGCRPVGEPYVVTAAEENRILELGGVPAAKRLQEVHDAASPGDRRLMQQGIHLGIVADEYRDDFTTGDFLVRAVLGADPDSGAVIVGDLVEVGRTVQFQVRDAASAHDDLDRHLSAYGRTARGALLFTCNGRGRRFFSVEDHDVALVGERLTDRVAGAFCAGEIGPVGPRSFLHGFTASLAVFRDEEDAETPERA